MLSPDQKELKKSLEAEIKNIENYLKSERCERDLIAGLKVGLERKRIRLQDLKNYE